MNKQLENAVVFGKAGDYEMSSTLGCYIDVKDEILEGIDNNTVSVFKIPEGYDTITIDLDHNDSGERDYALIIGQNMSLIMMDIDGQPNGWDNEDYNKFVATKEEVEEMFKGE